MNSSKNSLSAFRYFKAGLKPFRKFRFWGPPSAIAIIALCYWQYRSNPAWLNTSFEQPEGVESVLSNDPTIPENQEIGLEMPLQSIAREAENQQGQEQLPLVDPLSPQGIAAPTAEQENGQATASPEGTLGLSPLTQNKKEESKEGSQASSIFTPLMPNVKNPSSIFSNNSNSQRQNNAANPSALTPIDGLMKPKPVTVTGNPLQNAMEQTYSGDATSTSEPNATSQPQSSQSEASNANSGNASGQSQQMNNNFSNQSAATQPLTQNSQSQPPYYYSPPGTVNSAQSNSYPLQGYQNPYLNSPVQSNSAQPSNQSYQQQPSYTYNNAPAPFPIPGTPVQAPAQTYQNPTPYLNTPVPQTPQSNQNQPNYSNTPAGTAQVQRAIEDFASD